VRFPSVSYRSVALAIGMSVGCATLALACTARAHRLGSQAEWLLARGAAEGTEYVNTFDGRHVDQELVNFQERRGVLERAHRWERIATALLMAASFLVVICYALFLLVRLQEQQLEPATALPPAPAPARAALPAPSRSRAPVQVR